MAKNLTAMESLAEDVNGISTEVDDVEEAPANETPTQRKRRKNRWKRGELKAYREEKKSRKEREAKIEELTNQLHEITVKIMTLKSHGGKGSPEHLGLREELHALFAERKALGYETGLVMISDEDREAAKRYKAERKKMREEKKARRLGNSTIKKRKNAKADSDEEEVEE